MQVPELWLRAYADPAIDGDALAEALTMAGLEVEHSAPVAPAFEGVVVARVLSVQRHPAADKLSVCEVDVGQGAARTIVCGAPNVAAGLCVPCALPGAVLPGGLAIRAATLRGVASEGMLCSAAELGISEERGGLLVLPEGSVIGQSLREALQLDERALLLKLTPNRGDCLSVLGVARELAAITGVPLTAPSFEPVAPTCTDRLPVRLHAPDLCGRFSGRVIRGLDARAATPPWMQRRLERSGQRPISALVDISNYVMLELGRPSHVFDLAKVRGGLDVRWGRVGEQVLLLNGQTVTVDAAVGVIADEAGVEALAGIMGGDATAVTLDTSAVFVEAAFWWPDAIRGRARRFNFQTEAGHRFERGVDAASTVDHLEYITRLICEVCGTPDTRVGPVVDQVDRLPARAPVAMRADRCRRIMGVALADEDMAVVFRRLGFAFEARDGVFSVTPPSWRFDIEREEDLIEEVARLHGFERIPAAPPKSAAVMLAQPERRRSAHDLRRHLAQAGYRELTNFSFVDPSWERDFAANETPIRVLNPIAAHLAVLRSTLLGGLVANLVYNLNRRAERVRVFEIGRVFGRDASVADGPLTVAGIAQPLRVAGLAYGAVVPEQWGETRRPVDYYDLKGEVETLVAASDLRFVPAEHPALHPGRSARVERAGQVIGWLGELHPAWQQKHDLPQAPVVFELDLAALQDRPLPSHAAIARHQALLRDVALWVDAALPVQRIVD